MTKEEYLIKYKECDDAKFRFNLFKLRLEKPRIQIRKAYDDIFYTLEVRNWRYYWIIFKHWIYE